MSVRNLDLPTAGTSTAEPWIWRELAATMRLAMPIALTQLGQVAMMTTDLALVGRLGEEAMAAAALGHTILFALFVLGMGLVAAVAPLAAQAFGARDPRMVRRSLRVGLWAAFLLGLPITVILLQGESILLWLGQKPETAALAARYLSGLAWSVVPGWWFIAVRNFMSAVNRPEPALWIMFGAVPINGLLAYALINGAFGLPHLDLLGAGIATTSVNIVMCVAAFWIASAMRPFRKYQVLGHFWRPDWPLFRKLLVIGLPISGSFALEYGLFAFAAIMMGWISIAALAAHQIALQIAAIMFMVPLGIGIAATVRVGQFVGQRDVQAMRRAGFVAIVVGALFMAAMTVAVALTRDYIPLLFLGTDIAPDNATMLLAAKLLLLGASFFIADGVQTIAAGALRGLNDTRIPLIFAAISFWAVGFVSAYIFAFWAGLGAEGVWIGLSVGLAVFSALLISRFHRLTKRGYMPELSKPA